MILLCQKDFNLFFENFVMVLQNWDTIENYAYCELIFWDECYSQEERVLQLWAILIDHYFIRTMYFVHFWSNDYAFHQRAYPSEKEIGT